MNRDLEGRIGAWQNDIARGEKQLKSDVDNQLATMPAIVDRANDLKDLKNPTVIQQWSDGQGGTLFVRARSGEILSHDQVRMLSARISTQRIAWEQQTEAEQGRLIEDYVLSNGGSPTVLPFRDLLSSRILARRFAVIKEKGPLAK